MEALLKTVSSKNSEGLEIAGGFGVAQSRSEHTQLYLVSCEHRPEEGLRLTLSPIRGDKVVGVWDVTLTKYQPWDDRGNFWLPLRRVDVQINLQSVYPAIAHDPENVREIQALFAAEYWTGAAPGWKRRRLPNFYDRTPRKSEPEKLEFTIHP